MRIKINPKPSAQTEDVTDPLLAEPDPDNEEYYRIHKSLIDDLIQAKELISENQQGQITDPEKWCEERGYFSLRNLLVKINAIQQAAKGKFGK